MGRLQPSSLLVELAASWAGAELLELQSKCLDRGYVEAGSRVGAAAGSPVLAAHGWGLLGLSVCAVRRRS